MRRDDDVELRAPRGLDDLGLGRVEAAVGDVLADRAVEQEDVLLHDADLPRSEARVMSRMSTPSIVMRPALVVEARQQRADRRLAGAGRADKGQCLAGAGSSDRLRQHGRPGHSRSSHPQSGCRPAGSRRRAHPAVRDLGLGGEQIEIAAEPGNALGIGLHHGVDLFDRPEEHVGQQQEGDELARGELPSKISHAPAIITTAGQAHAEIGERARGGHDPVGVQLGAVTGVVGANRLRSWSSLAKACTTRMPPTLSSIRALKSPMAEEAAEICVIRLP